MNLINSENGIVNLIKTTSKILETPSVDSNQSIQQALQVYLQQLEQLPLQDLETLKHIQVSILTPADSASRFLKADEAALGILKTISNCDPKIKQVAESLLEKEKVLFKMQKEVLDAFEGFKEEHLGTQIKPPAPFEDMSSFLKKFAEDKPNLAHLSPTERRVLVDLINSDTELLALESRAENLSRKKLLPEIQALRKNISVLSQAPELQKELEFDRLFRELYTEMSIVGTDLAKFQKELQELQLYLAQPIEKRQLSKNKIIFSQVSTLLPIIRKLDHLMTTSGVFSNDISQTTLKLLLETSEQVLRYRDFEENLTRHGLSLQELLQATPQILKALDGEPLLKSLNSLSQKEKNAFTVIQKIGLSLHHLLGIITINEGNKKTLKVLDSVLMKIKEIGDNLVNAANKEFSMDSLEEAANKPSDFQLNTLHVEARKLGALSDLLSHPGIHTAAQSLYNTVANEHLRRRDLQTGMNVLKEAASYTNFNLAHPLAGIQRKLELAYPNRAEAALGLYVSGLDTGGIKAEAIHASIKKFKDRESLCFGIKLNHHARENLHSWRQEILRNEEAWKSSLPNGIDATITMSAPNSEFIYPERDENGVFSSTTGAQLPQTPTFTVNFKDLGKVTLCADKDKRSLYDWVQVEMPTNLSEEEVAKRTHKMLTLIGCPPAMTETGVIDRKRFELMNLYRTWHPGLAFDLEHQTGYFDLSIAGLKKEILNLSPDMEDRIKAWEVNGVKTKEGFKGKFVPSSEITEQAKNFGALGLMIGMDNLQLTRLSLILKGGFLSCQMRYSAGIISAGASNYLDHKEGGAESVFTRLVTSEIAKNVPAKKMPLGSRVQVLIDLEAANFGNTYGYAFDAYGTRVGDPYKERKSLPDLVKDLEAVHNKLSGERNLEYGKGNEVMIRDYISPQMIRGILVQKKEDKDAIIKEFILQGLVEFKEGKGYILGKPIDQFVQLADHFKKEMWNA